MTDLEFEKNRLAAVTALITEKLDKARGAVDTMKKEIIRYREYLWEQHGHDSMPPEQLPEVQRQENAYAAAADELGRLEELRGSPYFARIDFKEDGEKKPEPFYIGRYGFIDDAMELPVYDWRSPVASMFYDYESGRASYSCPEGEINGELTLKRQFVIEDAKLINMFDTALEIQDEILQRMLSSDTGGRMKNIVTTIQREQNRAIRDESSDVLVVTGGAGSGKTSVALHRVSYLLYRHKETLTARNVAVFSPSGTFIGYISDVLPSLGGADTFQTTFQRFAGSLIGNTAQSRFSFLESQLEGSLPPERSEYAAAKGSEKFAGYIAARMAELSEKGPEFSGVFYMGRPVVTAAGLSKAFAAQSQRLTPAERLAKVRMGFYEKLAKIKRTRIAELKDELREKKGEEYFLSDRELTAEAGVAWMRDFRALEGEYNEKNMPDAAGIYRRILRDYFGPQAADGFDPARGVNYEDAAPLIVTGRLLGQIKSVDSIRHAVIDEAQDWSYMQFLALALTLRCSKFTILGDPAQAVDRLSAPVEPQRLAKAFGKRSFKAVKLGRTYRSTREITEFAASLIGADVSGAMDRHGEKPRTVCEPDEKRRAALVREAAMAGLEKHSTVAVITRTVAEAARLAELIGGQGIKLITDEDAPYQGGAAIMPACLTKGLEFDSVIVTGNFSGADSSLVYVCCTRALHSLTLILPEKIF